MATIMDSESVRNAMKDEFGILQHAFIDAFSGAMLGNQIDNVIDISSDFKLLGTSTKGNLKAKMDTLQAKQI